MLSHFDCPGAHPDVEPYIRGRALDRFLNPWPGLDYRLLVWTQTNGDIVAVAAHKRSLDINDPDGEPIAGTEVVVVAIAAAYRDSQFADRPTIAAITEQLMADIADRDRGDFVAVLVHPGNGDGERLVERYAFEQDGTRDGDTVYVRFGPATPELAAP